MLSSPTGGFSTLSVYGTSLLYDFTDTSDDNNYTYLQKTCYVAAIFPSYQLLNPYKSITVWQADSELAPMVPASWYSDSCVILFP